MTNGGYLGVDPGQTGALAFVWADGGLEWAMDMPYPLNGAIIAGELNCEPIVRAAIERVHSMPKQGVATSFKFGESYGLVVGAIGALRIPLQLVTPNVWKRAMGVTADKKSSLARAQELWPDQVSLFKRQRDNGRAEAALIALWLRDQMELRRTA